MFRSIISKMTINRKKKILYIAPHRKDRSPGQRFRFEQFIPFLEKNNWEITYSYIVNQWDDKILYKKGNYILKFWIATKGFFIRLKDLRRCKNHDLVLIYREAHFLGNTFFEKKIKKSGVPLIYDFDDAIWLNDISTGNHNLKWLKNPKKTHQIIALSTLVVVGNEFLYDYAKKYNKNVSIIPTSIDTNYHFPKEIEKNKNKVCIAWTGSSTTLKHFEQAIPFLKKIKEIYKEKVIFKVIVDIDYSVPELDLKSTQWKKETEITELNDIDIGIMPLPNDNWSKGKCGFKGLQYMALEKATVMSPVGVNNEIIEHEVNGFLANTDEEWVEILKKLIDSDDLRTRIGKAGRKTIVEKYSLDKQQKVLLGWLEKLSVTD